MCTALLAAPAGEYPELKIKAFAGRVMLAFLQAKVAGVLNAWSQEQVIPEKMLLIHGTLTSLSEWMLLLEECPRFLSQQQADNLWHLSQRCLACVTHRRACRECFKPCLRCCTHLRFLCGYSKLAAMHRRLKVLLWPIKPRLHAARLL